METTHRPEVVHQEVKHRKYKHEHRRTKLGLEPDHNHDTRHKAEKADQNPPERPLARENKSGEQENQQYAPCKLEVHFTVFLVHLRQACGRKLLADPTVGENHKETANDGQIAEEEVGVEDEAIAESLGNNNAHETTDGVRGVFAGHHEEGADSHGYDISEEEEVGYTPRYCLWKKKLDLVARW